MTGDIGNGLMRKSSTCMIAGVVAFCFGANLAKVSVWVADDISRLSHRLDQMGCSLNNGYYIRIMQLQESFPVGDHGELFNTA